MRFACGDTMRNPVRLFAFFVGLCCVCLSSLALAWEHWGGDRGGSRFSPLAQITSGNVGNLVRAWEKICLIERDADPPVGAPDRMAMTQEVIDCDHQREA